MKSSTSSSLNPATMFFAGSISLPLLRGLMGFAQWLAPTLAGRLAFALFSTPMPTKRRSPSAATDGPWRAEHWELMGLRLCTWRLSEAEGEPTRPRVLLVHGWAGSAKQMRPLAERLWSQGYEPLALDLPAHGHSQGWQTHMPQFVQALHAAAQRYGPLHAVVAHSLGAVAASHAVATGLPASKLVLIACSAPPRQVLSWFVACFGLGRAGLTALQARLEHLAGIQLDAFEPAWLATRLKLPLLLIHDEQDKAAPLIHAQALQQALPRGRLMLTQGLGHRRILADPAVAEAVLGHLAEDQSEG
ncbi:alpha/beta hydrolase [Roseateles oligotrophus]|uniref:Alpha/beta fold hydrolase n=1 Tax=Roseateles oligotrophus TaxID=1769250 RepID=A0ABT2YKV9_9BURK|nr:alpha/beta fold hydrolase [Roseateles oligotrophus]MCV2370632.1 alpha/beta fold hydrolase [Roseateles oligotrophus]